MKKLSILVYFMVIIVSVLFGCKKDDDYPTSPPTYTARGRESGETTVPYQNYASVTNNYGPIVVDHAGDGHTLYWSLNKVATASSQAQANVNLDNLSYSHHTSNDTIYIDVVLDPNKPSYQYSCTLSLSLPYRMRVVQTSH